MTNPLLSPWTAPFGLPPFAAIADADWKPSNTFGTAGEWATFVEDEYNAAPALACSARLLKFVAASAATGVISAK